jgi:hypothetical protein
MLDFRKELLAQIARAAKQRRPHVEVNAGELHRIVSRDENRHAMACRAMRELKLPADEIIYAPIRRWRIFHRQIQTTSIRPVTLRD